MGTESKGGFENSKIKGSLTIVGLGPGAAGHLSLETLKLLEERFVILRTEIHPTVAELKPVAFHIFPATPGMKRKQRLKTYMITFLPLLSNRPKTKMWFMQFPAVRWLRSGQLCCCGKKRKNAVYL